MLEGHSPEDKLPPAIRCLTGVAVRHFSPAGEAKHVFTHQVWLMRLWLCEAEDSANVSGPWRAVTETEMNDLALPTAMRTARSLAFDPAAWEKI